MIVTKKQGSECCSCKRQESIDGKAWVYCDIFNNQLMELEGIDETGETHGCIKGLLHRIESGDFPPAPSIK